MMRPMCFGRDRSRPWIVLPIAILATGACLEHPLKPVEYDNLSQSRQTVALEVNKDVDILFVIDNSGSMGEEQATLAQNFANFIAVLEEDDVRAHYRIGITTTDNGNPRCSGTGPEAGKLVLSSCRSRTQDFVFTGDGTDATDAACLAVCPEEWDSIATLPTTTDRDADAKPRPWIENIGGLTNLPEGLSTVQAFQCLGPQGISGCGFEEHLEAMHKALRRATTDDDPTYGFLRDKAMLAVVFVTDEEDCSLNRDHEAIFDPNGSRVFWSDLEQSNNPTSAVCWNAGVQCSGSPSGYDECHAVNFDANGNELPDDRADEAVLHPLARYRDLLQSIEDQKERDVIVAVIGGVGNDGSASYADSTATDPTYQHDFGIGPGCSSGAGKAVPPVRLAEFAEQFELPEEQSMFSICQDDYSQALRAIANIIRDRIKPACMPLCVADMDRTNDVLDPQCTIEQSGPNGADKIAVKPCGPDGEQPSDEDNVCYVIKWDGKRIGDDEQLFANADPADDMHPECAQAGWNLEFDLRRRDGHPAPAETIVSATCEVSSQRGIDCPMLN